MSQDNVQALPPGTRLGDYRLDAVIGHGGFGITYRAFDSQLAKIVAIKEYLPVEFAIRQSDGQVVPRSGRVADDFAWGRERFLDEARALARFRHAHIVPVLRYFEANGTAYTVMEFEDGKSVAELLREPARRLPPDEVRRLAYGVLAGLGAMHAQDFLHRDIKPSNIIVRRDGVPVLIDFGAARQAMGERSRTLTGVLTPQYAPIEQYALDGKQGPWSDIYSAAAVLHHAIAGQPPPDAAARVGVDPYRSLASTHGDRFEPVFLNAIDRALAFAPAERPQSVREWSTLFGPSLSRIEDAPTQRLANRADAATPRLGGVSREQADPASVGPPGRSTGVGVWIVVIVVAAAAAARAARPDLENAERLSYEAGASYIGQVADGKRQGLGAANLANGERQAGQWEADHLNGLGTVQLADDTRYAGQWRDGQSSGLGVREKPGVERAEGNFVAGRLEGLGVRRTLAEPNVVQSGEFHDDRLEGPGVEAVGEQRYEGGFRAGRRNGYGQVSGADGKVQAGRWVDGKAVETTP